MTSQDLLIGWALTHSVGGIFGLSVQSIDPIDLRIISELCVHPQSECSLQWLPFWRRTIPVGQHFLAAVPPFLALAFDVRGSECVHAHQRHV